MAEYAVRITELDVMVKCDEPLQPEQIDDFLRAAFGDVEYRGRHGLDIYSYPDGLNWEVVE